MTHCLLIQKHFPLSKHRINYLRAIISGNEKLEGKINYRDLSTTDTKLLMIEDVTTPSSSKENKVSMLQDRPMEKQDKRGRKFNFIS